MPIIPGPPLSGAGAANINAGLLVGDIVQAIREAITDQPQTLPAVANITVAAIASPGATLPNGTYNAQVTYLNPWGETIPVSGTSAGPSFQVTIGANQAIQVSFIAGGAIPIGASSLRVYINTLPGASPNNVPPDSYLQQTIAFPVTFPLNIVISAPLALQGSPPNRNSAYLPDTDGDAVNVFTMYRWVNDALKLASQVCGGLLDYSGISTIAGVPQYFVPGQWKKVSSCWYDGYPLAMDDAGNYFRRNAITASVLASVALSVFDNRMMLEVWPQPSRSGAQTTLGAPLGINDTIATLANASNFLLTNGFVLIGNEIMSYSQVLGNTLQNLVRGLSGTAVASAATGVAASELNLFWQGWRKYSPSFQVGQSTLLVPVPVGWETILQTYGLARMKLSEQSVQEYSALKKEFEETLKGWFKSNNVVVGPRQVGELTNALEVHPTFGGGFVIP